MIRLQKQKFKHDPENGTWGDCHRTAIAMLLGLDRDEVPHFYDGGDEKLCRERVNKFLQDHALVECDIPFPGTGSPDDVIYSRDVQAPGLPYLLGGKSRLGFHHSVVIHGREMFDPSPVNSGIVGPCEDGYYWITYIFSKIILTPFERMSVVSALQVSPMNIQDHCPSAYDKLCGVPA